MDGAAKLSIRDIQNAVCEREGLSLEQIKGHCRERYVTWPRQVAIALARELTGRSYTMIGAHFGGRRMESIYATCRKIRLRSSQNPDLQRLLDEYRFNLARRSGRRLAA